MKDGSESAAAARRSAAGGAGMLWTAVGRPGLIIGDISSCLAWGLRRLLSATNCRS